MPSMDVVSELEVYEVNHAVQNTTKEIATRFDFRGKFMHQIIKLKDGLDSDTAKKVVKLLKENGHKVQASIQGDKVRVSDKKRDTLQTVMAFLREQQLGLPLQFNNFKD